MSYLQQHSSQTSNTGGSERGSLASGTGREGAHTSNGGVGVVGGEEGRLGSDGGLDTGGGVHSWGGGHVHVGDVLVRSGSGRRLSWGSRLSRRSSRRQGGGGGGGSWRWSSGGWELGGWAHGGVDSLLAVDGGGEGGGDNVLGGGSGRHRVGALGERADGGVDGLDTIDLLGHHGLGVGLHGGGAHVVGAVGDGDVGGVVLSDGVHGSEGGLGSDHRGQADGRQDGVLHD